MLGRFTAKSGTGATGVSYDLANLRRNGDMWERPDEGVDLLVFRTLHFEQTEYQPFPVALIASQETYAEEEIKAPLPG